MMHTPSSVSPDGDWVIFTEVGPQSERGIYRLHLTGAKETVRVPHAPGESNPQISPNGRWLAVEGVPGPEIYVRAFAAEGPRTQVSRTGGAEPAWSPDGTKLYFEREGQLWVTDVATGAAFSAGVPRMLIDRGILTSPNSVTSFSVNKDGRVLRVEQAVPQPPSDTINLVLNWGAELARVVK
jgi:Tol biopolymer transport system component